MGKEIKYIVISVSGFCNLSCKDCFRIDDAQNMTIETFESLHDLFVKLGVKDINFTGGEPLCNPSLDEFLCLSKEWGFNTILSTNGTLFDESNMSLLEKVDVLALSLDGETEAINDAYRGCGHFKKTLELINTVSKTFPCVKIKINTLVTSHNVDGILGIADILSPFSGQIICWKLFQVSTRGVVNKYEESDLVSNDAFIDLYNQAIIKSTTKFHMNDLKANDTPEYCMIRCNGSIIFVDKNGDYREISSVDDLPFSNNDFSKTSLGYEK